MEVNDDDGKPRLVNYAQAPIFTKDNKFLLQGYRCNYNTP